LLFIQFDSMELVDYLEGLQIEERKCGTKHKRLEFIGRIKRGR
jgi:hypothetical protein